MSAAHCRNQTGQGLRLYWPIGDTFFRGVANFPTAQQPTRHNVSGQTEHLAVELVVRASSGEVVEGVFGDADDVPCDERRTFARAVFGVLQRTLPFHDRPTGIVVLRELGED